MQVSLVYLVLNAILESLHKSSYKNNNSGIDDSNSFTSWTILPVEGMGMCQKLALSYNQQLLSVRKCYVTGYGGRTSHVQLENRHAGCSHASLHPCDSRALCVPLHFPPDSSQGTDKGQQTEKAKRIMLSESKDGSCEARSG